MPIWSMAKRISWDEAVDTIAARWREIIAADSGAAILPYSYLGSIGRCVRRPGPVIGRRVSGAAIREESGIAHDRPTGHSRSTRGPALS